MFLFASSLELADDMMQNKMVRLHANQVLNILDKIVILLTKSLISEQDKITLFELGKDHYHFGLKKEHFQVFSIIINIELSNFIHNIDYLNRYLKCVLLKVLKKF
jgi:hypothetical protein